MALIIHNNILSNKDKEITVDYKYLILLCSLLFIHLLGLYKPFFAFGVSLVEALIIILLLMLNKVDKALLALGTIVIATYDNAFFFAEPFGNERLFSIINLPFLSNYFILVITLLFSPKPLLWLIKNYTSSMPILVKFGFWTMIVGLCVCILSFLSGNLYFPALRTDLTSLVLSSLWTIIFFYHFTHKKNLAFQYEKLVFHSIIAYIIVGFITSSLGVFLVRGARELYLLLPLASFFISSVLLFSDKVEKFSDKIFILLLAILVIYFQLFYDSCLNGKSWIVFSCVLLVKVLNILNKHIKNIYAVLMLSVLTCVLLFSIFSSSINEYINKSENEKLLEFVSIFDSAKSGDIDDMGDSAQFRIIEFISISEYYLDNPLHFITGKGIGGYVPNYGYFPFSLTAFTENQFADNKFYSMHETINVTYLKFGIWGLLYLMALLIDIVKNVNKSPWFFVGGVWVVFFWSYSLNILFFALPMLVFAYVYKK